MGGGTADILKYAVPASVVSAGLYSFVLSHCWYGICDKRKADESEEDANGVPVPPRRSEPAVTIVCGLLEAVCLYHLSRATPGKKEGVATTWLEVSVLGSLLHISQRLLQNSIVSVSPRGGLQLSHISFDVARVCGATALLLGIENALVDLSDTGAAAATPAADAAPAAVAPNVSAA
eukprot:Rhum_TRINITY_DN14303_c4_g1::Rhum_TRINITY_DN14303_c4_g1_i1::g.80013::m.80013